MAVYSLSAVYCQTKSMLVLAGLRLFLPFFLQFPLTDDAALINFTISKNPFFIWNAEGTTPRCFV